MTTCRTIAEVIAAARADAKNDPPLTQEQADYCAALLAPYGLRIGRARLGGHRQDHNTGAKEGG